MYVRIDYMTTINATNFRKNIYSTLEQTIKYSEPVSIVTKDGNAVIISEEDYRGLMETLAIYTTPGLKEAIIEGRDTPISECIPADKVEW
jgi:PHD/YefM family antitoxin component YafN of YafNO toxin-antitoxin module